MPKVARLTKHCATLVKRHERLVKHHETHVKHHEPLVKYHQTLEHLKLDATIPALNAAISTAISEPGVEFPVISAIAELV